MAITSVKEHKGLAKTKTDRTVKTAERVFVVTTDAPAYPDVAENGCGVAIGSYWPGESGLGARICIGRDAQARDEYSKVFEVRCSYENVVDFVENPLDRPSELEIEIGETTQPYFVDSTGKQVATTSGEPFDTFLERGTGEVSATYTVNEADSDIDGLLSLMNSVNSASYTLKSFTVGARSTRVCGVRAQYAEENGVAYWKKSYNLKLRPQQPNPETGTTVSGWYHLLESRGYMELKPVQELSSDGTTLVDTDVIGRHQILTGGQDKQPVSKPWPLDEEGKQKLATERGYIMVFKPYEEKPYGSTFSG